jgi:hypothetical protein
MNTIDSWTSLNHNVEGTISRDIFYVIFFINNILLVILEVLYEDFNF